VSALYNEPKYEEGDSETNDGSENKTDEGKGVRLTEEETKTPRPPNIKSGFTEVVPLELEKEKLGAFIGRKGVGIKRVLKHIKSSVNKENEKLRGNVSMSVEEVSGDDSTVETGADEKNTLSPFVRLDIHWNESQNRVEAELTTNTSVECKIMKDSLQEYVVDFNNRPLKPFVKRKWNTKFVFKTDMEHHKIPLFIGKGGVIVQKLKDDIRSQDSELSDDNIRVNIQPDRKIRMKYLKFDHLKNGSSDEQVLITVEMNSNERDKSFEIAKGLVLHRINGVVNYSREGVNSSEYSPESPRAETSGLMDDLGGGNGW
jgi:hypothetical protein